MQEKSALQDRAERAAKLFPDTARKPIVIEFAGTPKAGKTSTIGHISTFLKRCGFKVEIVVERASVCPVKDKKHANFNVWTACTTLSQLIEKTQIPPRPDDPQILFLDRGIFDSICWLRLMEKLQRLRKQEKSMIENFLLIPDWRDKIAGVILMTASPVDSMQREQGVLPFINVFGSIMNESVLEQMTNVARETMNTLKNKFRVYEICTSNSDGKTGQQASVSKIADIIITIIEEHLREDVLHISKSIIKDFFEKETIDCRVATELIDKFCKEGIYAPRKEVENNTSVVQALPIVVVRNASGQVLRLRRKERSENNPLHEKLVVWAGGHVRKEDSQHGNAILQCVVRELEEELRLRIDINHLKLLGAIYTELAPSSAKHIAIVYEWRSPSDDIEVVISNAEFFERRGTSLSGRFQAISDILCDIKNNDNKTEIWSEYIITKFLSGGKGDGQQRLF